VGSKPGVLIPLVCPACRRAEGERLLVRELRRDGSVLRCACGRAYPIVRGIPVVLQDLEGWALSEGAEALRDPAVDPEVVNLLARDAATLRNRRLLDAYAAPLPCELGAWLDELITQASGPVLEVGAGVGHPGTVRLDLNLTLLAHRPSPPLVDTADGVAVAPGGAIVADAADPPWTGGTFATVVLANVLDSCREPALVLAHAEALLHPGGQLVITCAYAFEDSVTPSASRFTEQELRDALDGARPFGPYPLELRLTAPPVDRAWRLRAGPRTEHVHRVQTFIARRSPPSDGAAS